MADVTFRVTISEEHERKLGALADEKGISPNELIERFIDNAAERSEDLGELQRARQQG
jgi:hypothetical protein